MAGFCPKGPGWLSWSCLIRVHPCSPADPFLKVVDRLSKLLAVVFDAIVPHVTEIGASAACPLGHPKWELPTEQVGEGESKEAGTTVTSIRCHNCNEMGHKASQCPYATNTPAGPAGRTPQQGEQQTFNGKVTAVKEGFCFMESRPGER